MCWYSAEHSGQQLERAEAGQRLVVRKMHCGSSWVVKESDLNSKSPAPVCLLDGTRALLRPTEFEQNLLQVGAEPGIVFRMRGNTRRDVFEFEDGRQIEVNRLPEGLIFDVLMVPGSEHLSDVLKRNEKTDEEESVFARLRRSFQSVT